MITAGVTAAVAGLLSLFGIAPGPYLVGVAIGVKIVVVVLGVGVGARFFRRRTAVKAHATSVATSETSSETTSETTSETISQSK